MRYLLASLACLIGSTTIGTADPAEVAAVSLAQSSGSWTVSVTISHGDTGWDDYADGWRVEAPGGDILGTRVLHHPACGGTALHPVVVRRGPARRHHRNRHPDPHERHGMGRGGQRPDRHPRGRIATTSRRILAHIARHYPAIAFVHRARPWPCIRRFEPAGESPKHMKNAAAADAAARATRPAECAAVPENCPRAAIPMGTRFTTDATAAWGARRCAARPAAENASSERFAGMQGCLDPIARRNGRSEAQVQFRPSLSQAPSINPAATSRNSHADTSGVTVTSVVR
jgi:hypothetical protein